MPREEKIYGTIRISDLCDLSGLAARTIRTDISRGKLRPESLADVIRWLNTPRIRANKGKPLTWLNNNPEKKAMT